MFRNFVKPVNVSRVNMPGVGHDSSTNGDQVFTSRALDSTPVLENTSEPQRLPKGSQDSDHVESKSHPTGLTSSGIFKTSIHVNGTIKAKPSNINQHVTNCQSTHLNMTFTQLEETNRMKTHSSVSDNSQVNKSLSSFAFFNRSLYDDQPQSPQAGHDFHHPSCDTSPHVDYQRLKHLSDIEETSTLSSIERRGCSGEFDSRGNPRLPDVLDSIRSGSYSQRTFNVIPAAPGPDESTFVGLRDVRNPESIREREIVSVKGTVRGYRNRVRAGIATFWAQSEDKRNYRLLEQGRIVVYATSMSVVRETSERCKSVRQLLQNHMVRYEERDLYMSREIQHELAERLAAEGISVVHLPHVFADGIHIGGAGELEKLNEAGELRGLLDHFQKVIVRIMCVKCGGYRYVPCQFCHGSKKSLLRNHFTEEFCALRCMHCDENGLRRCDQCSDQQE